MLYAIWTINEGTPWTINEETPLETIIHRTISNMLNGKELRIAFIPDRAMLIEKNTLNEAIILYKQYKHE